MIEHGYQRTTSNHCVFVKIFNNGELITLFYMLIIRPSSVKIGRLNKELNKYLAIKDIRSIK